MKDFLATVFIVIAIIALFVVMGSFAKNLSTESLTLGGWFSKWSVANPGERAHLTLEVTEEELWTPTTKGLVGDSPWKGLVNFDVTEQDTQTEFPEEEYMTIRASIQNTKTISLKGWSLESSISGTRIPLPQGVLFFVLGRENKTTDIVLAPGEFVHIMTGSSPLATSFHTNTCSGQLSEGRNFIPALSEICPAPSALLPPTIENVRAYGEECIEYIQSLQPCETPLQNTPPELLPVCRSFIAEKLTYNKCVEREYKRSGYGIFNFGGWYLYLNAPAELWRNKYDVIRLLDPAGRVVDVVSY